MSIAPGSWERISIPHQRTTGCSEENARVTVRFSPSMELFWIVTARDSLEPAFGNSTICHGHLPNEKGRVAPAFSVLLFSARSMRSRLRPCRSLSRSPCPIRWSVPAGVSSVAASAAGSPFAASFPPPLKVECQPQLCREIALLLDLLVDVLQISAHLGYDLRGGFKTRPHGRPGRLHIL